MSDSMWAKEAAAFGAEPIQFEGWWQRSEELFDCPEPWLTFTVLAHSGEAGDMRPLLPEDLPAFMESIGAKREYVHADEKDPTLRGWVWVWPEDTGDE